MAKLQFTCAYLKKALSFVESKKLDGEKEITKENLEKAGLIDCAKSKVKLIMGKGVVDKKLKITVDAYSEGAKAFA